MTAVRAAAESGFMARTRRQAASASRRPGAAAACEMVPLLSAPLGSRQMPAGSPAASGLPSTCCDGAANRISGITASVAGSGQPSSGSAASRGAMVSERPRSATWTLGADGPADSGTAAATPATRASCSSATAARRSTTARSTYGSFSSACSRESVARSATFPPRT